MRTFRSLQRARLAMGWVPLLAVFAVGLAFQRAASGNKLQITRELFAQLGPRISPAKLVLSDDGRLSVAYRGLSGTGHSAGLSAGRQDITSLAGAAEYVLSILQQLGRLDDQDLVAPLATAEVHAVRTDSGAELLIRIPGEADLAVALPHLPLPD